MVTYFAEETDQGYLVLDELERRVFSTPKDYELILRYIEIAISSRQLERGKSFFKKLLNHFSENRQIRKFYISFCIQLKEYNAAMEDIENLIVFSKPEDDLIDAALRVREKIGPKRVVQGKQNSLSVCMIVRNEQHYLPACLNAIKKFADEIVVLDTGSDDRSADIARVFGARVFHYQWQEDFAEARNAGLEQAEGDWVLAIDADELIALQDIDSLIQMMINHQEQRTAFRMETRNYTHQGNTLKWHINDGQYPLYEAGIGWFPTRKIRLFPNIPSIRFQFPVHELVEPSVQSTGFEIKECQIPIHHYGHLNEARNKIKANAYYKIGYAKLDQLGNDFVALRELAVQAGQLSLWSESLELWNRLLKLRPDFTDAYVNMAGACWQMGRYDLALKYAQKALDLGDRQIEATYNMAVSLLLLGKGQKAYDALSELHRHQPDYLAAWFMMGAASACLGNIEEAISTLENIERKAIGKAIIYSVQDLAQRVHSAGLIDYSNNLNDLSDLMTAK